MPIDCSFARVHKSGFLQTRLWWVEECTDCFVDCLFWPSMFLFSGFSESFLHIVIWGSCRRLAALNEANRKALVFSLHCLDSSSGSGLSCSLKPGFELWPLLGNRAQSFSLWNEVSPGMHLSQGTVSFLVMCDFKFKTDPVFSQWRKAVQHFS